MFLCINFIDQFELVTFPLTFQFVTFSAYSIAAYFTGVIMTRFSGSPFTVCVLVWHLVYKF